MKTTPLKFVWLLEAVLLSSLWPQPSSAQDVKPKEIGPRIGERAPAFTLKDQEGKEVSLEALLKKGPVAVVFYRSAEWCMFCKFELIHLQHNLPRFEALGAQVVGISYDSARAIRKFADSKEITFPLLSDRGSKIIDAYGVRDTVPPGPQDGFAAHATFVLDQKGIVRAKLLKVMYQEQPGVDFLLDSLRKAQTPPGTAQQKPGTEPRASRPDVESANPQT